MAFMEWADDNRIGIEEVDEQHRQLFAILNRLHAAVTQGREQETLLGIMDELVEHALDHFQTEERLYLEHDYPGRQEHKNVHDALAATALELQGQLRDGSATLDIELLDFLHDWLMGHTMGLDKEMGKFFNARGVH